VQILELIDHGPAVGDREHVLARVDCGCINKERILIYIENDKF
jgi:hypothetical protein